jgi:deoxyribonuclease-4
MPPLGSHTSIACGYHKAVEIGKRVGCDCVQIFTKNNNQWRAKPITPDEAAKFKQTLAETGIKHPIAHDSYLINLASPDDTLWKKSIDAFVEELRRAETLGLESVVTHPGAFTTSSEEAGLARIVTALDEVHAQTPGIVAKCLLENTAGQGSNLGWRFEHLAEIISKVRDPERLGVCIDTCHTLAAGYKLGTREEYEATIAELDRVIGLDRVRAIHVNDSLKPLGSRVDRHAHIGEGCLGLEPFRRLLNDERFGRVPMYLETEKGERDGEDLDVINLRTLRGLIES